MFAILKDKMAVDDYNEFMLDYEILYLIRKSKMYKSTMHLKDDKIFVKSFFDCLKNKYCYIDFKKIIVNDKTIHTKIQSVINEKGLLYGSFLLFHYTIEIYIAFMIEYIIKQEIENKLNINILTSEYLDIVKKCDLYINGKAYQIKSYSFIENNKNINKLVADYKETNSNLLFIFYRMEADNIYFVAIDNKLIVNINEINAFTVFENAINKPIEELIKAVSAYGNGG